MMCDIIGFTFVSPVATTNPMHQLNVSGNTNVVHLWLGSISKCLSSGTPLTNIG